MRLGLAAGLVVSAVDLYAAGGHVPPVVIVALPLPAVHAFRHARGWPDTISPNTWDSIVMMALFALAVAGAGFAAGAVLRAAVADDPH